MRCIEQVSCAMPGEQCATDIWACSCSLLTDVVTAL